MMHPRKAAKASPPPPPPPQQAGSAQVSARRSTKAPRPQKRVNKTWTKRDNAAWWRVRRAAIAVRGGPVRETRSDGKLLFTQFACTL
jgi:hypothetical protein